MRRIIVAAALTAGLVAVVALAIVAIPLADYPDPAKGRAAPSYGEVVNRTTDLTTSGQLRLTWGSARTVRAVSLTGTVVTDVRLRAGRTVGCGTVALEVDGSPVVTLCGHRPLWRPIDGSSSGPDAQQVMDLLRSQGVLGSAKPTRSAVDRAIRRWQKTIGHEVTGVVLPSDVLWIGASMVPSAVSVKTGDVVTGGLEVLSVQERLTAAQLVSDLPSGGSGPWVAALVGDRVTVPLDAARAVTDVQALEKQVKGGLKPGTPLPGTVDVVVRLVEPIAVAAIPASAVVSGPTGTCVVRVGAAPASPSVVAVSVVDSQIGTVLVTGPLVAPAQVLLSPPTTATC